MVADGREDLIGRIGLEEFSAPASENLDTIRTEGNCWEFRRQKLPLLMSRLPVPRQERSAFGQLKLNAAIAPIGVLGYAGIDRLKFAEPGGNQAGRLDALDDQILYHGDRARRRQIPV